jgi:hypothetical protein
MISEVIAKRPYFFADFVFQFARAFEHRGQFACKPPHFLIKRFAIAILFLDADIASGRENKILFGDFGGGNGGAKPLYIRKRTIIKRLKSCCDFCYIIVCHFA